MFKRRQIYFAIDLATATGMEGSIPYTEKQEYSCDKCMSPAWGGYTKSKTNGGR